MEFLILQKYWFQVMTFTVYDFKLLKGYKLTFLKKWELGVFWYWWTIIYDIKINTHTNVGIKYHQIK